LNIPIIATDESFELEKDGTFRFADKKPVEVKEERYYTKAKVKAIRKAFRKQFEF
jgi:hypothetical protein